MTTKQEILDLAGELLEAKKIVPEAKDTDLKESSTVTASGPQPNTIGAYHVNGKTISLQKWGPEYWAPISLSIDGEPWKDAEGEVMKFNGQKAAMDAFQAMQSGHGSHVPKPPMEDGGEQGLGLASTAD